MSVTNGGGVSIKTSPLGGSRNGAKGRQPPQFTEPLRSFLEKKINGEEIPCTILSSSDYSTEFLLH